MDGCIYGWMYGGEKEEGRKLGREEVREGRKVGASNVGSKGKREVGNKREREEGRE